MAAGVVGVAEITVVGWAVISATSITRPSFEIR